MRITLYQPESRTGDPEGNVERLLAAARDDAWGEVIFAPVGTLEGGVGGGRLEEPAYVRRIERALHSAARDPALRDRILFVAAGVGDAARIYRIGEGAVEGIRPAYGTELPDGTRLALTRRFAGDLHWSWRRNHALWEDLARDTELPMPEISTSLAGAEGTAVFRGESQILAMNGRAAAKRLEADALTFDWDRAGGTVGVEKQAPALEDFTEDDRAALLYGALVSGIRNYVERARLSGVVIGLSGGIDSALTASAAVDALGAERVYGVMLRSQYTSVESLDLVRRLTSGLGLTHRERSIEALHALAGECLREDVGDLPVGDVTDQNVQARLRGLWFMTIANKRNALLLCNANKAESAMGYGTLYGDLAGGFAPIADLWKREVRLLCRHANLKAQRERIPEAIIVREPTAELRPDQKDSDSLPPYEAIELAVSQALRGERPADPLGQEIVRRARSFAFKRAQSPAVLKLSPVTLREWDAREGV